MREYQICEEDQAVRKRWLWLTIVISLVMPFIMNSIEIFFFEGLTSYALGKLIGISLLKLLSCYILYYCAYKHIGTKLLTFNLILGMMGLPLSVVGIVFEKNIGVQILCLFYILLFSVWLYTSYYLRIINKKIMQERLDLDPDYINGIKLLQESTNLEDLKLRFSNIVRETPAISFAMKKQFKKLKKSFA